MCRRFRSMREMLLLTRAFVIAEALLRQLDPGVNVIEVFRGQVGRLEGLRFAPDAVVRDGADMLRALEQTARDLPRNAEKILRRLGKGELGRVRDEGLTREVEALKHAVGASTAAIAGGAAVIAAAVLMTGSAGVLFWVGLGAGVVGGLALIRAYLKTRLN
jgi:ubiquinone biosynthesis protein